MLRVRVSAVCGALLSVSARAHAEPALIEQLRVQAGYVTEARPPPQPQFHDLFVSATPQLTLLWEERASLATLSYALTGALHSDQGSSEIAHRVVLANRYTLTGRTTLVLGAMAAYSSLSNLLVSDPAARSTVTLFPAVGSRFFTVGATQALSHELAPRWRLDQQTDASFITTVAPTPPLDAFSAGAGLAAERVWSSDGVGLESRAQYAIVRAAPPAPEQKFVTMTAGPRWRHDWSGSVSSLVSAGVTVVTAPGTGAEPTAVPSERATLLYTVNETTTSLIVESGIVASPVAGPVVFSHQATLQARTPLSRRARVYAGAAVGVQHATLLDRMTRADLGADGALADAEITWAASSVVQLFARYQLAGQSGGSSSVGVLPTFVRNQVLVGVVLSSLSDARAGAGGGAMDAEGVTRLPQRVDRSDGTTDHASTGGTDHDAPTDVTPPAPHPPVDEW